MGLMLSHVWMMEKVSWAMDWIKHTRNMVVCKQSQRMNSNEISLANMQDRLSSPLLKDPADVVSLAWLPPYLFQLLEPKICTLFDY